MSSDTKHLGSALLDAARSVGTERGVDLVLHALFVRWLATQTDGQLKWRELGESATDEELVTRFMSLDMFRGPSATARLDDTVAYRESLRTILRVIDKSISWTVDATEQRAQIADAFDETLGHLSQLGRQSGEFETPPFVADLMAELTVRAGDHVFDPVCGIGTGLLTAARAQPGVSVSGLDINDRVARRASMRLMVHGVVTENDLGVRCGDAFSESVRSQADVVIAQPPWNLRFSEVQREAVRRLTSGALAHKSAMLRGDMLWLLLALDALRPEGRAALVLSSSSLTPRYRHNHEHLLRRGAVEAIIALPPRVFRHTGISTALWLLRKPTDRSGPDSLVLIDAQTLTHTTDKGHIQFGPEAIATIADIIATYRSSGTVSASAHVARSIAVHELHLDKGLDPSFYLDAAPEEKVTHPEPDETLLTQIEISNFKAFSVPTQVPLAPLTLIYGANSAGKSTVIQSLLLLKQSRESDTLVTQGPLLNVGGFRGVVHRHASEPMKVALTYGTLPSWIPSEGAPDPALTREVAWTFESNALGQGAIIRTTVSFGEHQIPFDKDSDSGQFTLSRADLADIFRGVASGTLLYPFDARHHQDGDEADQAKRLRGRESNARRALRILERDGLETINVRSSGLLPTSEVLLPARSNSADREIGIAESYLNRTARLAGGVAAEIEQLLNSVVWLGPLRSAPQRVYDRADTTSTLGDGRHVAIYLFDHATVVTQVNDWLKRLEVPYVLDVIPVNAGSSAHLIGDLVAISLTDTRTGVNVTPADVGFGISQVLPIVVELLSRRDSIVAIEQPETHLHPRLQTRLADLFIDTTQEGRQGNQLIVETHSEHLILRVQRRIREGGLDPRNVSVVYVDQGADGTTTVKPLRLNEHGEFLDEWPHGFFDERLDELFGEF
jgi:predicted ATPase